MSNAEPGTIGVAICTFGQSSWLEKSLTHALPSIEAQTVTPTQIVTIHMPLGTLAQARNQAVYGLETEWVVFLDADDQLEPDYIEKIPTTSEFDILAPLIRHNADGQISRLPASWHISANNWIVIGAPFRRKFFMCVGGFQEFPGLEDWDLWIRMEEAGAKIGVFDGCYRVFDNPGSRNKSFDSCAVSDRIRQNRANRLAEK